MKRAIPALPYAAAAAYVLFLAFYLPLGSAIEFGADEGFELIKAFMVSKGFSLYDQIWNDQPPLHTLLLASLFKAFGPEVWLGRALSLFFSGILLFSVAYCLKRSAGPVYALMGVLLLAFSPYYPELSISVMLEVPAMAVACFSVVSLLFYLQSRKEFWLYASALVFALALQIKLTGVLVLPALLFLLYARGSAVSLRKKAIWFFIMAASVATIFLLTGEDLRAFFESHLGGLGRPAFRFSPFFGKNWEILMPLILLSPILVFVRDFYLRFYAVFAVSIFVFMFFHRPFWYYYELQFAIAAALILPQFLSVLPWRKYRKSLTVSVVLLSLFVLGWRIGRSADEVSRLAKKKEVSSSDWIEKLVTRKDATQWFYTDRPIYAFHAQFAMPPFLALIPYKRSANGLLTPERIASVLKDYRPAQILLFRLKGAASPPRSFLDEGYQLVSEKRTGSLFVRKDLIFD